MGNSDKPPPLPVASHPPNSIGIRQFVKSYGTLVFFLVLIVVTGFYTPRFFSKRTLFITLVQAFPIVLVALGMTLVVSSGGIDISVGAIMAVSGAVSATLYTSGVGLTLSLCCGVSAAIVCGLFNGVLISIFRIQPIIVTLVVMFAGRGLAQMILDKPVQSLFLTDFHKLGTYKVAGAIPVQVVMMLVVVAVMLFIAKKTVFAKHVEAMGNNRRASRLAGINTLSITIRVYALCSILCAIAGNMAAARGGAVDASGLGRYIELDAIAAVAIGGTCFSGGKARILGTVLGAVVVQLVTVVVTMKNIQFEYSLILKAMMLIVAVWVQRER